MTERNYSCEEPLANGFIRIKCPWTKTFCDVHPNIIAKSERGEVQLVQDAINISKAVYGTQVCRSPFLNTIHEQTFFQQETGLGKEEFWEWKIQHNFAPFIVPFIKHQGMAYEPPASIPKSKGFINGV